MKNTLGFLLLLACCNASAAGLGDTILKGIYGHQTVTHENNSESQSLNGKLYGGKDLSHTLVASL